MLSQDANVSLLIEKAKAAAEQAGDQSLSDR